MLSGCRGGGLGPPVAGGALVEDLLPVPPCKRFWGKLFPWSSGRATAFEAVLRRFESCRERYLAEADGAGAAGALAAAASAAGEGLGVPPSAEVGVGGLFASWQQVKKPRARMAMKVFMGDAFYTLRVNFSIVWCKYAELAQLVERRFHKP